MEFIEQYLQTIVTLVMKHMLIQLSGPVGTCKSTLARLIAQTHQVPVVLVDELGKNQKFYLILVDGTTQLLTPETVLPGDFKVVIANCGTNPKNLPDKKNGTFPAAETQKLGNAVGSAIATKIKTAIEADAFFKVETWKLLDALADKFGVAEARKIWTNMVFSRPDNSYVQFKTQTGPLTPSQQALSLFADWGKGFQPWSKTVVRLTAPNVKVLNIQPKTINFVPGYLDKGVYYEGEPPVDVELNKWYGKQMLPVPEEGDIKVGEGKVPHVTLGNYLPFKGELTFGYKVVLTNSAGEVVGTANYALADGHWYHMTTKASGIPPATLGHRFVKDALKEFASSEASTGGVKTE